MFMTVCGQMLKHVRLGSTQVAEVWWMIFFFSSSCCIFPQSSSHFFRPELFSGYLSFAQKLRKWPWRHLIAEPGHRPAWKCLLTSGPPSTSRVRRKMVLDRYIWSSTWESPLGHLWWPISASCFAKFLRRLAEFPSNFIHNDFGDGGFGAGAAGSWLVCDAFFWVKFLPPSLYGEVGLPNRPLQRFSASYPLDAC